MVLVSVIVPVYNTENYLHRCIDSIIQQTFTNFELLLVDDGSTDNSGAICDEYAERDNRVKVFHQSNRGQAAARNFGIKNASGDWICFVDADDAIHCQLLQKLIHNINNTSRVISICDIFEHESYEAFCAVSNEKRKIELVSVTEDALQKLFDSPYVCWVTVAKLIPIDIIKTIPFTEGHIFEDNAVVVKWLYEAGTIVYTPEQLYFYQINPEGTTKSAWSEKRIIDSFWYKAEQLTFFEEQNMNTLFSKFYTPFLKSLAENYYKYRDDYVELAKELKKTLKYWWKKNNARAILSEGEKQYILSIVHPLRESFFEWTNVHFRGKRK
ncbi:MAG: glycosyltransferase family 2 protein [Aeriscardovia sp.]|nr:glycosyltransferase family 2 protein [Aeriscardovia sp.]